MLKIGKIIYQSYVKLLLSFTIITEAYSPLFKIKLHLLSTFLLSVFYDSPGALKPTEEGSTW